MTNPAAMHGLFQTVLHAVLSAGKYHPFGIVTCYLSVAWKQTHGFFSIALCYDKDKLPAVWVKFCMQTLGLLRTLAHAYVPVLHTWKSVHILGHWYAQHTLLLLTP